MKILLGISGGIAAYKSANLVRAFKKRGDDVRVVMTRGATEFITPLTLQVLSEHVVGTEIFDPTFENQIGHIDLARWPDLILIAPATANLIAKYANGIADDLLTTILLATLAPVIIAPAMNTQMLLNAKTQRNLERLKNDGAMLIEPDSGELACKEVGKGRLPDPDIILDSIDGYFLKNKVLEGKHILITAGPTREYLDPARFLSNPSSGKMGYALAESAKKLGAIVTLISGPSALNIPNDIHFERVITTRDMYTAVMKKASTMDVIVMAAAPADWRPEKQASQKEPKIDGDKVIKFVRTPDILKALGEEFKNKKPYLIGFAAESHDILERGRAKRIRKKCDALIANKIGGDDDAFGSDENSVHIISEKIEIQLEKAPKKEIAFEIWKTLIGEI